MAATRTPLPPHLAARYGERGTPWYVLALVGLAIAGFVAAFGLAAYSQVRPGVEWKLLAWDDSAPDHVSITFEVRKGADVRVSCVLRAQDEGRADVGYAVVVVPQGNTYDQVRYELATNTPAYVAEVLGCSDGDVTRTVPPPQFPPGIAPPPQPWQPAGAAS